MKLTLDGPYFFVSYFSFCLLSICSGQERRSRLLIFLSDIPHWFDLFIFGFGIYGNPWFPSTASGWYRYWYGLEEVPAHGTFSFILIFLTLLSGIAFSYFYIFVQFSLQRIDWKFEILN